MLECLSSGAKAGHNEDWVGSFQGRDCTDLVIVDGGTSVAERDYIDAEHGDVVWFVAAFATALGAAIDAGLNQHAAVHAAVDAVYAEFLECSAGNAVPQYAWPIAALSWVRVTGAMGARRLSLYCLGDCKVLMRASSGATQDLDPFVNPQEAILQAEIAKLLAEGVQDGAARRQRLLPMLRARREFQNTSAQPSTLCLRPNGAFQARVFDVAVPPGAAVLGMTDGFYRLVDTYGLHTPDSLTALCLERGLQAAHDQLRRYELEATRTATTALKRADDASAILWRDDGA